MVHTAIHPVKPDNMATFLGAKLHWKYEGERGSRFNQSILGTRIKHQMGAVSIKMYDKFGSVLRIETTVNDVLQFKISRDVQQRDGTVIQKVAPMKKNITACFHLPNSFKPRIVAIWRWFLLGMTRVMALRNWRNSRSQRRITTVASKALISLAAKINSCSG